MRVKETVEIRKPVEEVWSLVAEPANDPQWCPKVTSVEQTGPGRWTVMHKPIPWRPAVSLTLEQTELEPPTRLRIHERDDASVFEVEYRLVATKSGTRFTQVSDFTRPSLPRWLHPLFAHGVRRDIRGQLRELKKVLEAP